MASGTITGSGSYVTLKISWSSSAGTGGSTVKATLYAVNDTYDYYYATVNNGYSLTINGTKTSGSTATLSTSAGGTATLISNSVWVAYTGSKSITISGTADMSNIYRNGSTALGTRTVSGTATLDTVGSKPSASTVSAPTTSTISETATSITVKWAKNSDSSATYTLQVSKNGGSYTNIATGIANATVSYAYTITAGQGNTYRFRVCAVNSIGSSDYSYSGTVTTNKLTAPTIGTLSTFNPYVSTSFSIPLSGGSQTNGSGFMRRADVYMTNSSGTEVKWYCGKPSNGNTSITVTVPAADIINALGTGRYSAIIYVIAWSENSNGSRSNYVTSSTTVNINSDGGAVPTLNSPTLSGGYTGYTSTCFIAGIHSLTVTSGSASANRAPSGTTLKYSISCTGFSSVASSSATFSKPTAGKKTIKVTVTDSRGLSTSKTVDCRFQSWAKPTISITSAERDSTTPTTIKVVYTVSYSPIYTYASGADTAGTQINAINTQQYTTASSYTACTSPITITGTSEESTYTITIRASDKIATTTYGTASKTVGTAVVYVGLRSYGVGLNCIPTSGYRLDVSGNTRLGSSSGYNVTVVAGRITSSILTSTYLRGNTGYAIVNSSASAGAYTMLYKGNSTNGYFTIGNYQTKFMLNYTAKTTVDAGTNSITYTNTLLDESGNASFGKDVSASSFTAGSSIFGSGKIELYGDTPYIDFHYGSSTADYTSRLIASASNRLTCTGGFNAGSIYVNNYLLSGWNSGLSVGYGAYDAGYKTQIYGAPVNITSTGTMNISGSMNISGTITMPSSSTTALSLAGGVKAIRYAFTNDKTSYITSRTGGGFDFWFTSGGMRICFDGSNGKVWRVTADGTWTALTS